MAQLHVLRLSDALLGFDEGRAAALSDEPPRPGWTKALSLGIRSLALVDGADAIVYDTHVSVERAGAVRHPQPRRDRAVPDRGGTTSRAHA